MSSDLLSHFCGVVFNYDKKIKLELRFNNLIYTYVPICHENHYFQQRFKIKIIDKNFISFFSS